MFSEIFIDDIKNQYILLHKMYYDSFSKLSYDFNSHTYEHQYAIGGQSVHRGYYSPTCLDIFIQGYNRGHILKNTTNNESCYFEYLFSDNKLVGICEYINHNNKPKKVSTEFLIYDQKKILGLRYDHFDQIGRDCLRTISVCQTIDGLVKRYERAFFSGICTGDLISIDIEETKHNKDESFSIIWTQYSHQINSLSQSMIIVNDISSNKKTTASFEHIDNNIVRAPYSIPIKSNHVKILSIRNSVFRI